MATTRLPGIYFETVSPPVPALLPRMDVAAFAGFLPSGPIGLPFMVEDSTRFEEIFGTDLQLAWDSQNSQMLLAQTPPTVRAFFRNGGKRCWVLRLAENALSNAWSIPGLLQVDNSGQYSAGWVQARSEGSWSDDLTVNATLLESPLAAGSLTASSSGPQVSGLSPGDTVQLYYQTTETWAYHTYSDERWFWFQAVQPGDILSCGSPPAPQPDSVTLLGPGSSTAVPWISFCAQGNEMVLTVTRDTALTVAPGSWLRIELAGRTLLMQVESMQAAGSLLPVLAPITSPASPPQAPDQATLTSALAWWVIDPDVGWSANQLINVQASIVEFELWAMPLDSPTLRIADLGLVADHPRYWGLLPTDSVLYAPVINPAPLPYAALSSDIDHPRFPLAGPPPPPLNVMPGIGLPLGMTTLVNSDFTQAASLPADPSSAPCISSPPSATATALYRDGLACFDLSLFADLRLVSSNSTTLLQDAFGLQYQAQPPSQPTGLYALLSVDEPSMLAVPEANLNGWFPNTVQSKVLSPPDPLQVSEASASGNYTVSWALVRDASGYLLQESTDPTFETGVNATDVGSALSISLQNNPECAQQLFYRVSAHGTSGSGPWSGTGSVELGTGDFYSCNQLPLNAPQLLISEEPNRIILEWNPAPGGFDGFTLEIGQDPQFNSSQTLYQGSETGFSYWQVPGPASYFRVNTQRGGASSPWSNTTNSTPTPVSPWIVNQTTVAPLMLSIHLAMLRIAAARGDMVAIFNLPLSYHTSDVIAYPALLAGIIPGTESGRILSYGAVYHPWLIVRDSTAPLPLSLRTIPPDGAVCGAIATTTLADGAWIAPANVALNNVVDLDPALTLDAELAFDTNQINLIIQAPEGFLVMGQYTLVTVEPDLQPLNVRRLLILIRRLALREGVRYVFENISPTFQRQVTRLFEYWMQQMLERGAFAGQSAQDSYRVIADQTVNPQDSIDQGRFIVQLQVAPSVPMRFLTVQLTQSDGQLSLMEA